MYIPPAFKLDDIDTALAVMRDHPFAILVAQHQDAVEIVHLPLLVDRQGDALTVRGHVARANPAVAIIEAGGLATAVFTGPNAYLSPDWYAASDQVPTWNYVAVHAAGTLRAVTEPETVIALLADLSAVHEEPLAPKRPWTHHKMKPGLMQRMIKGVLAFDLPVDRLEAKAKMSQNKKPVDRDRAAGFMRDRGRPGDVATADWM